MSSRGNRKDILENFHFSSHLPPKSEIESRSNRHLTQSRLQVTGCTAERYCLLHVLVKWQGIGLPREFGQLFSTTYVCGATGRQSCPIFEFWPFSPCNTSKKVQRGVLRHRRFPVTSGRELGPPNLPKFSPMANGYIHTES